MGIKYIKGENKTTVCKVKWVFSIVVKEAFLGLVGNG